MTRFDIDTKSAVPAYQQVMQAIKLEIMSGRLKNGDQLPSIRDLAKLLKLNPNTVAKAYYNLEAEGFIESRIGSGNWVKFQPAKQDTLRRAMLETELKNFLEKAVSLGFNIEDIKQLLERFINDE
ncbi:MAG: hypothetical protein A2Y62_10590 [Candidatus Fischerbacteria bacterium RBG_13_37_8]|uniref:HTH gntR-type domain-containing protein n=1 Tax=Candidatus Fischerbacteria bacterium RBG_13_37_8 TaxID=1817863 RepID=A0A1F5VU16_9BACT|nr:MAG: hypothetical protein A2Y62_10590 [Candidatus Fischerbacteria bacterium RBG_13_37_8]